MESNLPTLNGSNGRLPNGRFGQGNPGGPGGDPNADKAKALRVAMIESVTVEDMRAIVLDMVKQAREGCKWSRAQVLDRVLGKPAQAITGPEGEDFFRRFLRVTGEPDNARD